ncbi:beta-lactamase family protein [Mesorhizobium sp. M0309]|uniref:serine hydrolase domain-containing protein n=1 Tax=Mesorhizobium sp. M0309 TaxID=2956933 RepID=UPI00333D9EC8
MVDKQNLPKMSVTAAPIVPGLAMQSKAAPPMAGAACQPDPMRPGAFVIPQSHWAMSPHSRWTYSHVRELTRTASIWRGPGPVLPLPQRLTDIDRIEFATSSDGRSTIRGFLDRDCTDGFLVLHRGHIVAEKYMNGMEPHMQHTGMSVSKSVTGTVFGILVHKGLIDPGRLATDYLPELEATAYRGAKVQHLLDMAAGVKVTMGWYTPNTDEYTFYAAAGFWPGDGNPDDPINTWQAILRLTDQEAPHGARWKYRDPENDVLGFIMQRVTGRRLPELYSSELWRPMGAEEDAYLIVDQSGQANADGGFNATLRDYARFALLHLRDGNLNGKQIISPKWIEETRSPNSYLFKIFGTERRHLPNGAYHNTFWIEDAERRAYWAIGSGGQTIYIDPEADFAAVKLSHWPEPSNQTEDFWFDAMAAIRAIRDAFAGR